MLSPPPITVSELPAGRWLVELRGDQDITTSGDLRRLLHHPVASDGDIIVDLTETTFLDSGALAELVLARQQVDRTPDRRFALVVAPGSAPASLLTLVDADGRMFGQHPNRDAALHYLDATHPSASES